MLGLVVAGKTDRQISEELVIAVRTVSTHMSSILSKTGSSNRTEAACYAAQHGLTE